jgi:thymidylate kinase
LDRASEHERFEIIDAGNPLQEVQAEVRLKTSEFIRRARRG